MKHYFLLDKGDLLVSFLDNAEEELSKPASEVSVIRLKSLLDLGQLLCHLVALCLPWSSPPDQTVSISLLVKAVVLVLTSVETFGGILQFVLRLQ